MNIGMDELFFLVSFNDDDHGKAVNYVTNRRDWQQMLVAARANGWEPRGTILDYECHYQLEASKHEEIDRDFQALIDRDVRERCAKWQGGYLAPEYQIVTDEDAMGLRKALHRVNAPLDLLMFLSHGAFRIAA